MTDDNHANSLSTVVG